VVGFYFTKYIIVNQATFNRLEQKPFAYWAGLRLLSRFSQEKSFGTLVADVLLGAVTGDNERYLRLYWEVMPSQIISSHWSPYPKGGDFSKYYRPIHLLVNWKNNGKNIELAGGNAVRLRNVDQYFMPGLTFPLVNEFGISISALPSNCVFDNTSPSIFPYGNIDLYFVLGVVNSRVFEFFLRCLTDTRHWQVGYVRQAPWIKNENHEKQIIELSASALQTQRSIYASEEIFPEFIYPIIFRNFNKSLDLRTLIFNAELWKEKQQLLILEKDWELDNLTNLSYDLSAEELEIIGASIGPHVWELPHDKAVATDNSIRIEETEICNSVLDKDNDEFIGTTIREHRTSLTKLETLSWRCRCHPQTISKTRQAREEESETTRYRCSELLSYLLGNCFGRWDIRYIIGERQLNESLDPFGPLPACSLGMLQNTHGLPISPQDSPADYPLHFSWSGILVDDPGHPEDVTGHVREAFHVIWHERAETIEQEACQILGVRTLREYFQKPALFFAEHLKRYSKSRRQAPIYWPLSTPSGSYTLWLYYHRLSDQILFTCVNDFVDPKLKQVSEDAARLRLKRNRSAADEKELERLVDFERELKDFRSELLRVAACWKPDLNDGVQITAAPLWRLFQHRPWQRKLKETWEKLEAGDYDWAHLAYSIWPDRVREKCKTDKSLAIAHDLEHLYIEPPTEAKKKGKKKQLEVEMEDMFDE
jgi:hypothetical protein